MRTTKLGCEQRSRMRRTKPGCEASNIASQLRILASYPAFVLRILAPRSFITACKLVVLPGHHNIGRRLYRLDKAVTREPSVPVWSSGNAGPPSAYSSHYADRGEKPISLRDARIALALVWSAINSGSYRHGPKSGVDLKRWRIYAKKNR